MVFSKRKRKIMTLRTSRLRMLVDLFGEDFISALDTEDMECLLTTECRTLCRLYLFMGAGLGCAQELYAINQSVMEISIYAYSYCHRYKYKQSEEVMKKLFDILKRNTSVKVLECWNLINQEVEWMANMLKENRSISSVLLYSIHHSTCPKGFASLAEAIRVNNAITSLNLELTYVGPNEDQTSSHELGTALLIDALSVNKSLKTLRLNAKLCKGDMMGLASTINHTVITELDLDQVLFDVETIQTFAEAIEMNKNIITLRVCSFSTSKEVNASKEILRALKNNRSVREVYLTDGQENTSEKAPLSSITELIKANRTVSKLHGLCTFDTNDILEPTEMLKNNNTVALLGFCDTDIETDTLATIDNALRTNYTLQYVLFEHGYQMSSLYLKRNREIFKKSVSFALRPSIDIQKADSFQKTRRCSALISKLITHSKTEAEALCLIKKASNFVDDRFFIFTRIVETQIVCLKKENMKQLDELSNDVISLICSYLKLSDIKLDADHIITDWYAEPRRGTKRQLHLCCVQNNKMGEENVIHQV